MRKIIHIDMDCFYAAVECRDAPELKHKPVAVGGSASGRGVLCTANYKAREFGVRAAMPSFQALKLCPDLILLPVNMAKYRTEAQKIRKIFHQYTHLVEPLSLDEAFLDVSHAEHCQGSATLMAKAIKTEIADTLNLTASAGVAPNKFLAKIASDWKKPNGLFTISPHEVSGFIKDLPITKIFGVGKVTAKKFAQLSISTCGQLQAFSLADLVEHFGNFGVKLYELSRGIDDRPVNPTRERKSISVETTFEHDLNNIAVCHKNITELYVRLTERLERLPHTKITKQFIKIKFQDFTQTTVERASIQLQLPLFQTLFEQGIKRVNKPIRLLGIGVRLQDEQRAKQLNLL